MMGNNRILAAVMISFCAHIYVNTYTLYILNTCGLLYVKYPLVRLPKILMGVPGWLLELVTSDLRFVTSSPTF